VVGEVVPGDDVDVAAYIQGPERARRAAEAPDETASASKNSSVAGDDDAEQNLGRSWRLPMERCGQEALSGYDGDAVVVVDENASVIGESLVGVQLEPPHSSAA